MTRVEKAKEHADWLWHRLRTMYPEFVMNVWWGRERLRWRILHLEKPLKMDNIKE